MPPTPSSLSRRHFSRNDWPIRARARACRASASLSMGPSVKNFVRRRRRQEDGDLAPSRRALRLDLDPRAFGGERGKIAVVGVDTEPALARLAGGDGQVLQGDRLALARPGELVPRDAAGGPPGV